MDAVILGASPNALSAARSLGRFGLEVVVMEGASGYNDAVRASRYVHRFTELEDNSDDAVVARLMALRGRNERTFLLATGDRYALLVAKYQDVLRTRYAFVCPSYAVLEAIIDKAKLYSAARDSGVLCPAFHVVRDHADIELAIARVPTPCYVKPAMAHHWRQLKKTKVERADTQGELRRILEYFVAHGLEAVPQEIIPGKDSDVVSLCAYFGSDGRCAGWRTKRKLHQWPLNAGDGVLQEIYVQPEVAEIGLKLLSALGHRGPATVEFRRDARSGRFVLIEINARTIMAQELITRSGLDVPVMAYRDAMGLGIPAPGPVIPVRWVYFGEDVRAFRAMHRAGQVTAWHWFRTIAGCNSFAYFAIDDIRPFMERVRSWVTRRLGLSIATANRSK